MARKVWFITGASKGFGMELTKAALAAGDHACDIEGDIHPLRHEPQMASRRSFSDLPLVIPAVCAASGQASQSTVTLRYEKMASRRYSADARTVEQRPSLCKCSCPGNLVPNLKAFGTEFSVISGGE
jgi:hypothetical protein